MKLHLHQFLSRTGAFPNKKAAMQAVNNKEITIDGKIIKFLHYRFNPDTHEVFWNGKKLKEITDKFYILINKPAGYLSTKVAGKDVGKKKSVLELIENDKKLPSRIKKTLFCIGRLDEDSSGLLIITNDGKLGYNITNSSAERKYVVKLDTPMNDKEIEQLQQGVVIELEENDKITKYKTKPCKIRRIHAKEIHIAITEGKKREVRRMFESIGRRIAGLERIGIGKLTLEELKLESGRHAIVDRKFIAERVL